MTPKRPRGRPPTTDAEKAKSRRAQRRVGPRLFPEELTAIDSAARANGESREGYMRRVLLADARAPTTPAAG